MCCRRRRRQRSAGAVDLLHDAGLYRHEKAGRAGVRAGSDAGRHAAGAEPRAAAVWRRRPQRRVRLSGYPRARLHRLPVRPAAAARHHRAQIVHADRRAQLYPVRLRHRAVVRLSRAGAHGVVDDAVARLAARGRSGADGAGVVHRIDAAQADAGLALDDRAANPHLRRDGRDGAALDLGADRRRGGADGRGGRGQRADEHVLPDCCGRNAGGCGRQPDFAGYQRHPPPRDGCARLFRPRCVAGNRRGHADPPRATLFQPVYRCLCLAAVYGADDA